MESEGGRLAREAVAEPLSFPVQSDKQRAATLARLIRNIQVFPRRSRRERCPLAAALAAHESTKET